MTIIGSKKWRARNEMNKPSCYLKMVSPSQRAENCCENCGWIMDCLNHLDNEHKGTRIMEFNESGSKYLREVPCRINGKIDVYAVLDAFQVTCPARQHAIKKLLCAGLRGKGDVVQDLEEACDAVTRAIQMEVDRNET